MDGVVLKDVPISHIAFAYFSVLWDLRPIRIRNYQHVKNRDFCDFPWAQIWLFTHKMEKKKLSEISL